MKKIRAFIDLGTNTFHLLIAALENGETEVLYRAREIVGLGAGGINEGIIQPEAMERGLSCLEKFSSTCKAYKTAQINAFGTSALRHAKNSPAFIDRVRTSTGIEIEVIGGEREAELIELGISASVGDIAEPYLIMDIGGGSTEFILVANGKTLEKISFEVGVQRLISAFFTEDPLPTSQYSELNNYLGDFLEGLKVFRRHDPKVLVGASGTYTTLLKMYTTETGIGESSGTLVPADYFRRTFAQLIQLPREKRLAMPGMSAPRVDLIVVGASLVNYVIEYFNFAGFYVSGSGLKEGAMLLAAKGKL